MDGTAKVSCQGLRLTSRLETALESSRNEERSDGCRNHPLAGMFLLQDGGREALEI